MFWLEISNEEKVNLLNEAARLSRLPAFAIEKDWWLVQTLRLVFGLETASHLVFKGGSTLSKAWSLIERFSEDIDLALDREMLGFAGEITRTQVGKLRDESYKYISENFYPQLVQAFSDEGFEQVNIKLADSRTPDQDPLVLEIYYPNVINPSTYLQPKILIEIGSRSLREPFTERPITSIMIESLPAIPFSETPTVVPCANPERTYLEKLFLLHEEFQRRPEKMRVDRLSRHLYDIYKISFTPYARHATANVELYKTIVAHRRQFTHLSGVDYAKHIPPHLDPIPPDEWLALWEKDYQTMREEMIYGSSPSFDEIIARLHQITAEINQLQFE